MPEPNVSVCIPVYRGERFLAETMRSVLDQTHHDFELVVIDNASDDGSAEIARAFTFLDKRVRVVTNPVTLPAPDNWREAVRRRRAPLVKLLCADDLLHPRCLELQVAALQADPTVAVVAARRHMIDERGRALVRSRGLSRLTGIRTGVEVARRIMHTGANPVGEPGGVLFRRAHYDAVGGWRRERRFAMDLDLWVRLLDHGYFLGLPQALAAFRVNGQSLSADNEAGVYAHQKAIMDELVAAPHLQVRPWDHAVGRVTAPAGRLRRRALFHLSRRATRRHRERREHRAGAVDRLVDGGTPVAGCVVGAQDPVEHA